MEMKSIQINGSHHNAHHSLLLQFPENCCINFFDPPDEYLLTWITNKTLQINMNFSRKSHETPYCQAEFTNKTCC